MQLPENTQITRIGNTLTATMRVNSDLVYFNGHFSNTPVLAGVVQVGWIFAILEKEFHIKCLFTGVKLLKFTRIVLPNSELTMVLNYQPENKMVKFSVTDGDVRCASGNLMFELDGLRDE